MKKISIIFTLFLFLSSLAPKVCISSQDAGYSVQSALVDQATITFKSFLSDPDMTWFRENLCSAKALLIIPQLLKGAFIFGAEGGTGVLIAKDEHTGEWSQPVFYTLASASFGLQAGAETSSIILMIMTDKGMDALLSTSVKLGGDVSVAAGPYGAGAKAATVDVLAFARAKGAFGGISVEGSVIMPRDSYNIAYYQKNVRPVDIIIRKNACNPHSASLIKAVSDACPNVINETENQPQADQGQPAEGEKAVVTAPPISEGPVTQ